MSKYFVILFLLVVTIKLVPYSDPTGRFQAFWQPNFIIVYNYDELMGCQVSVT